MKTTIEIIPAKKTINSVRGRITRSALFVALVLALSCLSSCAIFVGEHHEGRTHGAGVIVK